MPSLPNRPRLPAPGPRHGPDRPDGAAVRREMAAIGKLRTDEEATIDLGRAALLLAAREKPGRDIAPYTRHLEKLVREVGAYAGVTPTGVHNQVTPTGVHGQVTPGEDRHHENAPDLDLMVEALEQVLVKRYGYGGTADSFHDPDGANMMAVIDNRAGLPVVLGAIFLHVCDALGWHMVGVNFPARFLVRLEASGRRALLDPFDGLAPLSADTLRRLHKGFAGRKAELQPHHYDDADARAVLLRILNNTKTRAMKDDRFADALDILDVMILIAPGEPKLWREVGLLNARLDNVTDAITALEAYLKYETVEADLYKTSLLLQDLRGRLR